MNKFVKILLGSLILDAAILVGVLIFVPREDSCSYVREYKARSVLQDIIGNFKQTVYSYTAKRSQTMPLSSGVVPHHLLAKSLIMDFFQYAAGQGKPDTVVLLSPDHFNAASILGSRMITVGTEAEKFEGIDINRDLLKKINGQDKLIFSDSAIALDHGITNLAPFIKEYFPGAKIVPIVIPYRVSREETEKFTELLNSASSKNTLVAASVDFSHYLPLAAAGLHDIKSIRTLIDFKKDDLPDIEVDSWQALYTARYFAELRNKVSPRIIGHYNSGDFSAKELSDGTSTSYFSVVFGSDGGETVPQAEEIAELMKSKTLLFVGDIMLDRGVEYFTDKNNDNYPYKEIGHFLNGVDIVFGNLEGPIVKKPKSFAEDSLQFAFSSDTAKYLGENFDVVSLANNHTLNMGPSGLEETRNILQEAGIGFAGDPINCAENNFVEKDGIIFLAFNKTFPINCSEDEIISTVASAKEAHPGKFIIVSIHWGNEYQLKSSSLQKKLGHRMIDAGADLIIGQHPHVVQEAERYNGKMIFYSLGNFIFDQSFSAATQEGLAIGAKLNSKGNTYYLFPIRMKKGQPYLMEEKEAAKFLNGVAVRTNADLSEEVKLGIIEAVR